MNDLIAVFHQANDDRSRAEVIAAIAARRDANVLERFESGVFDKSFVAQDRLGARFLAEIVSDSGLSDDIRLAAYCVLHEVTGRDMQKIGSVANFKVPDDFDSSFVGGYLL